MASTVVRNLLCVFLHEVDLSFGVKVFHFVKELVEVSKNFIFSPGESFHLCSYRNSRMKAIWLLQEGLFDGLGWVCLYFDFVSLSFVGEFLANFRMCKCTHTQFRVLAPKETIEPQFSKYSLQPRGIGVMDPVHVSHGITRKELF